MKTLVLTGADAAMASIADLTSANHRAYALRHEYEFERVTEYPRSCHPSWHKLALLQERLPDYKAILWLDADTVITNPSIPVRFIIAGNGLTVSTDWTYPAPEDEIKHFSLGNFIFTNCPGSFDLLSAASMRGEWRNTPLWEQQAIQEEYRANPEIRQHVHILPRRKLNAVPATRDTTGPEPWEAGDFLCHMTYLPNDTRCAMFPDFDRAGLFLGLPAWHDVGMCADARHIACLREICLGTDWKHALEVGSWTGCSTVAFLAGLGSGSIEWFSACDVGFTDEFHEATRGHPVALLQHRSVEVLAGEGDFDLIFVDGDHSLETGIEEAKQIIRRQPRCVVAHDFNSMHVGFGNCEGPAHLHAELIRDGWVVISDMKDRAGEVTKRGFMAATKDPDLIPALERAFALTCY